MNSQPSNNNNYNNRVNITTSSLTYFDEYGTMLKSGFLNENISIAFGNPVENNGRRSYPNEKRDNLLLTNERVGALYNIITDRLLPAIERKENYEGGVFTSLKKDNIFELRVEFEEGSDNYDIYAAFHRNIDADRKPQKTVLYKFTKVPIIEKYNTENGNFELDELDAQFFMFIKLLEGFILCGANNVTSHAHRNANRYTTDKIFKYLSEIATKLGVTVTSNSFQNNNYNRGGGGGGGFTPKESDGEMPVIEEVETLEGLL